MRRLRPARSLLSTALAATIGLLALQPAVASAEYVTDGSFETGLSGSSAWSSTSTNFGTTFCNAADCGNGGGAMIPRTGTVLAWFGGTASLETASVTQDVTVPAGRPTVLSFWLKTSAPRTGTTLAVSVGGVQHWSYTEATDDPAGHPYAAYTRVEVPIPGSAFDGGPTQLRFDFLSPGAPFSVNYALDDVSLVDATIADASASVSPTSGSVRVGDEVTYVVGLSNAGPNGASVSLRGVVPPELELVWSGGLGLSCTGSAGPGDALSCGPLSLLSGASSYAQLRFRAVASGTASLALTSEVAEPATDPDPSDDTATATLEIEPVADLSATIDAPADATAGTPFDVVVGAHNDGPSPATDTLLTTELPTGFTLADAPADCAASGTTVTCDLGTLADGDDAERTLRVVPGQVGDVELATTAASAAHDPDAANDRATAPVTVAPKPVDPGDEPPVTTPEPPVVPRAPAGAPPATTPEPPLAPVCLSERRFATRLLRGRSGPGLRIPADPSRGRVVAARLTGPRGWKARTPKRTRSTVNVDLRGAPAGRYTLRVRVRIAAAGRSRARTVTVTRTYRTCRSGR